MPAATKTKTTRTRYRERLTYCVSFPDNSNLAAFVEELFGESVVLLLEDSTEELLPALEDLEDTEPECDFWIFAVSPSMITNKVLVVGLMSTETILATTVCKEEERLEKNIVCVTQPRFSVYSCCYHVPGEFVLCCDESINKIK